MSKDIERILLKVLSGVTALPSPGPLTCRPVGGGSINNTYQVLTYFNKGWFCKFNDTRHFPDLFAKENSGLTLLRHQQLFLIPATVACPHVDDTRVLLLEWTDLGPSDNPIPAIFWRIPRPPPPDHQAADRPQPRQLHERLPAGQLLNDPAFYDAYAYHYPLPANHHQQWEVANLYPVLTDLNLFGETPSPALGYLRNILHTIQHF